VVVRHRSLGRVVCTVFDRSSKRLGSPFAPVRHFDFVDSIDGLQKDEISGKSFEAKHVRKIGGF
jgi:hypothetical protein